MTMAIAAAPSSIVIKYDVFISFRGDTRKNFTSNLYAALRRNQIKTYIDEENLERGEEISTALLRAIEESTISIVILSKEYASSRWCLDELVHILKCKKERGQIVLPIFYGINPSDVRKQKGSYGDVFAAHEERFKVTKDKVQDWRNALTEAANIAGFDSWNQYESKLIEMIVENVLRKLNRGPQSIALDFKGLVGIDRCLKEIESLLCFKSPNTRIIGLRGMGGIGKTVLARAVFYQFSCQFEGCCFLENVREDTQRHGLHQLETKLFSELLVETNLQVVNCFVRNRLRNKTVLVVLDDIDNVMQLERLVGDGSLFGPGSRIIVTTRDAQLLKRDAVEIYEVKALDFDEALELFYLNSFIRKPSDACYIELSEAIVKYSGGNPLALKVLGSFLHSGTIEHWESVWNKLKIIPHEDIQKVLKISYDELDDKNKDIFLDIACFLKGENRGFIESILDGCDLFASSGIEVLVNKSLVNIENDGSVWMHDLIQEMGWEIVRQQSTKELGERSRLWIPEDVHHVLENNEGTKAIEGMSFDMSKINEDLHLSPTVFKNMRKLRLLIIHYSTHNTHDKKFRVYFDRGDQLFLPHSLRYLCWYNYPSKSLPSEFKTQMLVQLNMPDSELKQLWNGVQDLANLKSINLSYSKQLIKVPDLSRAPNLESIILCDCSSLVELPPLNYQRRLGYLDIQGCSRFKSLPKISRNVKHLRLGHTAITELPSSIGSFESLVSLKLNDCQNFKNLPALPRNIQSLNLTRSAIKQVSSSLIEGLPRLGELYLGGCKKLQSLPTNIFKLKSLKVLSLRGCSRLKSLTETLPLDGSGIQESSPLIEKLFGLRRQDLSCRKNLEFVPNWLYNLSCLTFLSNHQCLKLEEFQTRLFCLFSLKELNLSDCNIVEIPDWLGLLSSLKYLDLEGNHFDKIPSSIRQLHRLKKLDIRNCKKLLSLPQLPSSINHLYASGCTSLETSSSSLSRFTLRHWTDGISKFKNYEFLRCWKLNQNALREPEFLCRVEGSKQRSFSTFEVCYPGNKVPKWFKHQSEGNSIAVKLSQDWLNNNFLGFAICYVAPLPVIYSSYHWLEFTCELHLKTKFGQIRKCYIPCSIGRCDFITDEEEEDMIQAGVSSDHVFIMLCKNVNIQMPLHESYDEIEASFILRYLAECWSPNNIETLNLDSTVKRMGVRLLYGK